MFDFGFNSKEKSRLTTWNAFTKERFPSWSSVDKYVPCPSWLSLNKTTGDQHAVLKLANFDHHFLRRVWLKSMRFNTPHYPCSFDLHMRFHETSLHFTSMISHPFQRKFLRILPISRLTHLGCSNTDIQEVRIVKSTVLTSVSRPFKKMCWTFHIAS